MIINVPQALVAAASDQAATLSSIYDAGLEIEYVATLLAVLTEQVDRLPPDPHGRGQVSGDLLRLAFDALDRPLAKLLRAEQDCGSCWAGRVGACRDGGAGAV